MFGEMTERFCISMGRRLVQELRGHLPSLMRDEWTRTANFVLFGEVSEDPKSVPDRNFLIEYYFNDRILALPSGELRTVLLKHRNPMSKNDPSSEAQEPAKGEKKPAQPLVPPEESEPAKAAEPVDPASLSSMEASFWDESQIQAVVRHAGAARRSPEEFFNKKWKDRLIHGKKAPEDEAPPGESADDA
jgi:hypothetical protein